MMNVFTYSLILILTISLYPYLKRAIQQIITDFVYIVLLIATNLIYYGKSLFKSRENRG